MSGPLRGLGRRLRRHARDGRRADAAEGDAAGTLGDLVDAHGAAAPGCMIVLLAGASALPVPGVGTVLGSALVALGLWAAWRGPEVPWPWPDRVRRWRLPASASTLLAARLGLAYLFAARHARTRWKALCSAPAQRTVGAVAAAMGALIALPIPFGNVLPALAGVALGLGLVARDGAFVAAGFVFALLAAAFAVALGTGAVVALGGWFG